MYIAAQNVLSNCYAIGKTIAQMHSVTKKMKLNRKNSMGIRNLKPLLESIKFQKKFSNLKIFLKINYSIC